MLLFALQMNSGYKIVSCGHLSMLITGELWIIASIAFILMRVNTRRSGHIISQLTVHIVWVTKYRYPVLTGDIQKRCRELLIQICDAEDLRILKGVVSKDHVHMHMEYPAR